MFLCSIFPVQKLMPSAVRKSATAFPSHSQRNSLFLNRFQKGKALVATKERSVSDQDRNENARFKRQFTGDTKGRPFDVFLGIVSVNSNKEVQVRLLVRIASRS